MDFENAIKNGFTEMAKDAGLAIWGLAQNVIFLWYNMVMGMLYAPTRDLPGSELFFVGNRSPEFWFWLIVGSAGAAIWFSKIIDKVGIISGFIKKLPGFGWIGTLIDLALLWCVVSTVLAICRLGIIPMGVFFFVTFLVFYFKKTLAALAALFGTLGEGMSVATKWGRKGTHVAMKKTAELQGSSPKAKVINEIFSSVHEVARNNPNFQRKGEFYKAAYLAALEEAKDRLVQAQPTDEAVIQTTYNKFLLKTDTTIYELEPAAEILKEQLLRSTR